MGKPKTSAISRQVYIVAAHEHIRAAFELVAAKRYVLANYVSGLAVECVIRAYRLKISSEFDERHDLRELARAARFFDLFPPQRLQALSIAFTNVVLQWENSHRYRSEDSLRKFLVERKLFRGIKGDLLAARAHIIVNAAFDLVSLGVSQWQD